MKIVRTIGSGLLVLVLGVMSVQAETVVTTSTRGQEIDAALNAALDVEKSGMAGVRSDRIARLTTVPKGDPLLLTGYDRGSLAKLPTARGGKEWACLTEALYFETRGETVTGQFAVAEVIMNRVASPAYPDTVCDVVRQGTGERNQCQFSFWCDGEAEVFAETKAHEQVGKVARLVLDGKLADLTHGATHYHTKNVSPRWAKVFPRTATIGDHHFYRQPVRVTRR